MGGPPFLGGESAYYLCANRNKQSITLNLKSEEGKEILRKLIASADVKAKNMIVEVEHPTIQNLKLTGSPLKLSKTPVTIRKHPPKQGEHTDLILQHIGFSENEISNLKSNKII